MNVRNR